MNQSFSRIIRWYFSRKALPYWCIFAFDCMIFMLSAFFVYALNNGVSFTLGHFGHLLGTFAVYLMLYVIGFRIFHTYSGVMRYSSFVDLQRIAYAMVMGLGLSLIARSALQTTDLLMTIRLRDMAMWSVLALLLIWASRVVVKYLYDLIYHMKSAERVFIYGVRQGGIALAKSIRNMDPARYVLAGFVTDLPEMVDHRLFGVRVYANDDSLVSRMRQINASAMFVSPLKADDLRENATMVNALIEAGIKLYVVPPEQQWDGKSSHLTTQLREVDIEDLLPREKIEVDLDGIGRQLKGQKILITGAAGSIGSEMARQVALFAPKGLILIDQAETPLHDMRLYMAANHPDIEVHTLVTDITNRARMREIFTKHRPAYVFHAAAYKHVPMMENNPAESIHNNVEGTRIVADLSVEVGVRKFVMVSTDKAVNPTNVMGASKRICEIYVQSLDTAIKEGRVKGVTQFVTTRFGNVLGSNGSVIPLFREQIRNGGPVTVTHPNIIRFFMLIPEACRLVLEAGVMGHGGEIFVFDMGQAVKIVDLARRMIKLSGADVEIMFTGLREGEKLYEEVLNDEEITLPTFHPKIKIAKVRLYDFETVKHDLEELYNLSISADDMTIVARMKRIVPEFRSQNSKYEVLDNPTE